MMNRFNNRMNQLLEHLAAPHPPPSPKKNVAGLQGKAREQNGEIPNGGADNLAGNNAPQEPRMEPHQRGELEEAIPPPPLALYNGL